MTTESTLSVPREGRAAGAKVTDQPYLKIDSDPGQRAAASVSITNIDPDLIVSLGQYAKAGGLITRILRVGVAHKEAQIGNNLPDIFGGYKILRDGVRFTPHFPFERGLSYRATFDPRPLCRTEFPDVLTLDFSLSRERIGSSAEVTHIFPTTNYLPDNLLRLYVCFSHSMQRGRAESEILLLGPDGGPAADVLYRAPVELWDRSMQHLTILLDPGRLKRGLGPNRELGPPLKVGDEYTLVVGSGLVELSGEPLRKAFYKRFRVTEPVREHVAVDQWEVVPPVTKSRQPLTLLFPRPLDWALLSQAITVVLEHAQSIEGRTSIDQCERRWSFTPALPWSAGNYEVRVASSLEDVCGNSVIAAFDRPLRSGSNLASETVTRSIPFQLV
jgi:hypothetical protein